MRKTMAVLATLILAMIGSARADVKVIPMAAHLPGANASSWTTDLSVTNDDTQQRTIDLVFHSPAGLRTRSFVLEAGESRLLPDVVNPAAFSGSNPPMWSGQLEVRSAGPVSTSARIHTPALTGGTYGSTHQGFDPTALSASGTMPGVAQDARFRTNLAFANPADAPAAVTYSVRGEGGAVVATQSFTVPPHGTVQVPLPVSGGGDDGLSVEWSADRPLYAVASVIDNASNDPTNVPSNGGGTSLFYPAIGRTSGANATYWSTGATIASRSDAAGTFTAAYRDNATGQVFTVVRDIAPRGTVKIDDLHAALGAPEGTGSLTISATVRVVAMVRVFNTDQYSGTTYGSAVLAQEDAARSSSVRIPGVRRDDDFRANVAISGAGSATSGTVRLFDDSGREVESTPFALSEGGSIQVAVRSSSVPVASGVVVVDTANGTLVSSVVSSIDNRTGDTAMREAEQENERSNDVEIRVSPKTVAIGAPVTIALANAAGVTGVVWNFGDGTSATGGASTTHTFTTAGEFDITAQITLASGAVVRDREDVHVVGGTVPAGTGSIDFTWEPFNPMPGDDVTFTATGATNGGTFKWKFPGDVRKSGNVATFVFGASGSFEVELELEHGTTPGIEVHRYVTIGGNGSSTGSGAPIDFTWSPQNPAPGETVTFTATGATNGGTFKWKFPGDLRPLGQVVTFTFPSAGSFEVELEIEHGATPQVEVRRFVTVGGDNGGNNGGTTIDFTWSPQNPAPGETVTFTATGATNGGFFKWNFPGDYRPTGPVVTFVFPSAGAFEVEVEIEHGSTPGVEVRKFVTVGGGSNGGNGGTATSVDFTWSPQSPKPGQVVTFTATANGSLPAGGYFKWKMPDDSRPVGATTTYTFGAPGSYEVEVEIEIPGGENGPERQKNVVVVP